MYQRSEFGARKSFYTSVYNVPTVVHCFVKNMDGYIVGTITSRVYPGLNNKTYASLSRCLHCTSIDLVQVMVFTNL